MLRRLRSQRRTGWPRQPELDVIVGIDLADHVIPVPALGRSVGGVLAALMLLVGVALGRKRQAR